MGVGAAAVSTDDAELRREGERIAQLIDDLGALGGAPVRQRVEELVARLVHLYGAGLGNLLHILGGDRLDEVARARLRADALVSSLLVLHGIHPDPAAAGAYDLEPEAAAPPAARAPAGLVQIDLARSRAAGPAPDPGAGKPEGGP
jgi:hypothetical protein